MNVIQLDRELSALVAELTPDHIKAEPNGLYSYFERKRDTAWNARLRLNQAMDAGVSRSNAAAVGGPLLAVGVIAAAGAVALPAAGAVTAGGLGYAVASAFLQRLRMSRAERAQADGQAILNGAADEVMRDAMRRDARGGLLSRFYRHVKDAFGRYERQATRLVEAIDGIPLSGGAHRQAVKAALSDALNPGLAEYLRRHAEDKHSAAAHVMARLHTYVGIDAVEAAARSRDAALDVAMFHGYVEAPKEDGDFLRSLGAELAPYDDQTGCYRVRCTVAAYCELVNYEKSFLMRLEKCTPRTLEAALAAEGAGDRQMYSALSGGELDGLREAVLFEDACGEGRGDALTRRSVLQGIHREVNDRWLQMTSPAEALVPGVDAHVAKAVARRAESLSL